MAVRTIASTLDEERHPHNLLRTPDGVKQDVVSSSGH